MTQQINGMVRERLVNCDTHFDNDQIEAVMQVVEDSGYFDLYEALKASLSYLQAIPNVSDAPVGGVIKQVEQALAKVEGK